MVKEARKSDTGNNSKTRLRFILIKAKPCTYIVQLSFA